MKKYIHFIWVGDKPIPKLAKKCIKSWEKFLPDYEIKKWSEENIDLEECPFIKDAYKKKKWAFVADYIRAKVINEHGGIYFDTDMEIIKDITPLLENESFLGVEDYNVIACGVWYERNPDSYLSNFLLDFYRRQTGLDENNLFSIAIPNLITTALIEKGFKTYEYSNQKLSNGTYIYSREYFYPISNDRSNPEMFTENTCMIHHYEASWLSKREQIENKIVRFIGPNAAVRLGKLLKFSKRIAIFFLYPLVVYRRKRYIKNYDIGFLREFDDNLAALSDQKYVFIHNPYWLGITSATKELYDNTLPLPELYCSKNIDYIAEKISSTNIELIVFSGFAVGYGELLEKIKRIKPEIKIKVLWHGSNSMHIEHYDWVAFNKIFELLEEKKLSSIGFVKKSMYELYKAKGYNVEFVMNTLNIENPPILKSKNSGNDVKIGLYASGDRWVKNFYNQLAGASLVKNANIDIIPISNKMRHFAKLLKTSVSGSPTTVKHHEILNRLARNDINVYVTFVECAPMLPLESFELGVPCITGDNHHYWEGTELEKYIVVDKEDNAIAIYEKIESCLKNKDKIMKLYQKWKKEYDLVAKENNNKFIK